MAPGIIGAQDTLTKKEIRIQEANYLLSDRPWTIEIPLWIPGFAGSFAYGDISIEGEDGVNPQLPIEPPPGGIIGEILSRVFTDEWYLKFFFLTKIAYEKNQFLAQFDAISGSVGESVKFKYNNQLIVQANYRSTNMRLFGGYKIVNANSINKRFQYELFAYGGARIHFQKIYSDLDGVINKLDINPTWVEPIIGLHNQLTWKRWYVVIQGDYGGYFVESKQSVQLTGLVYFRTGKLTSVRFGWNHLVLHHSGNFLKEDYRINATFSGPSAGVVFHF
ncbi:MAG: hypothetical protein KAI29_00280 [Cyclobacteriaceae bacterium]|nr:hypothetical protein [Cyclobacteriaceae bacterium]